jgi:hypothetical protein
MGTEADAPRVAITRRDGHLVFKLPFRPTPLELQPISPTEFVMPRTDGRFRFQKDDQGRVTGAVFTIGDGERTLRKVEP